MVILLSPAKTLDETPKVNPGLNLPTFRKETNELAGILKSYTPNKIKELMHISATNWQTLIMKDIRTFPADTRPQILRRRFLPLREMSIKALK